jgi:hypothetical protein
MSTLRHGKIEQAIAAAIAHAAEIDRFGGVGTLMLTSRALAFDVYNRPIDYDFKPTLVQRKAVSRAMHSFVRKHQQYALTGGQGRRVLYLYDAADPLSVLWTNLNVERRHRGFISRMDAKRVLREMDAALVPADVVSVAVKA